MNKYQRLHYILAIVCGVNSAVSLLMAIHAYFQHPLDIVLLFATMSVVFCVFMFGNIYWMKEGDKS